MGITWSVQEGTGAVSPQGVFATQAWIYDPDTQAFSPTGSLLSPRGFHQATLLNDGKVLITGGSAQWLDPWSPFANDPVQSGKAWARYYPFAEVFDPATGVFTALPASQPHPGPLNRAPFTTTALQGPGMMWSNHSWGSALKMTNGKVLVAGGDYRGWWSSLLPLMGMQIEGADLFDPAAETFDLSPSAPWRFNLGFQSFGAGTTPRMESLADGRVLLTYGHLTNEGNGTTPATGQPILPVNRPTLIDPDTMQTTQTGPMVLSRFGHTLTRLPDGRILAVGGKDYTQAQYRNGAYAWNFNTTVTAEIYDPATNTWTATGSLNTDRAYHAAIMLPTGQVQIVGGYKSDLNGNLVYPNTTELYDPDSGTFSVIDHMDYGLTEPQLAFMKDGGVFLAGQIQPSMEAPTTPQNLYWDPQAKRFLRVGQSPYGSPLTVGGGIFAAEGGAQITLSNVTMNQGVERYLNPTNSPDWNPYTDPKMAFKPNVPGIAGRSALIRFQVNSNWPLAASILQKLKVEVNTPSRIIQKTRLNLLSPTNPPGPGPVLAQKIKLLTEPLILEANETVAGRKISGQLDPDNSVLTVATPVNQRFFEVDPKWATKPVMAVRLIAVNYTDETGTLFPMSISEMTRQEVEAMLKVVYPVAAVTVSILPTPINYSAIPPGGGTPVPLTTGAGQEALLTRVEAQWTADGRPSYIHYSGVFPIVPGKAYANSGRARIPGASSSPQPVSVVVDLNLAHLGCSVLPHELGHNHRLWHTPTPAQPTPGPCYGWGSAAAPGPFELLYPGGPPAYPYPNGELGRVIGYNVVSRTEVNTVSNPMAYHDVMGYWYSQFPSDYFFTKASAWATSVAPPPVASGIQKPAQNSNRGPIISIDGDFSDGEFKSPKVRYVYKHILELREDPNSEWMIRLTHRNGNKLVLPVGTSVTVDGDPVVYHWSAYIPEDDWVSYRLLHRGKDIGGESFKDISDEMEKMPNQPIISMVDSTFRWNFPRKPTHGFSIDLIDEKGERIISLTDDYMTMEAHVSEAYLQQTSAPRVRITAGYGLKVRQFIFKLEANRNWTMRQFNQLMNK